MLEVPEGILIKILRNLANIAKWALIAVNVTLFYITFHFSTYISLSLDHYVVYGFSTMWFGQSYLSFIVGCWISAAVFLVVSWKSMAVPTGLLQMTILAATPTLFYLVFGELTYLML